MIFESLKFIVDELNKYFAVKGDDNSDLPVVRGNISRIGDNAGTSENPQFPLSNKVVISLVNIEEDRISRSPDNIRKVDDKFQLRNPSIHLNLYVLVTVTQNNYDQALQSLSTVMRFFQYRNVFNPQNSPLLPDNIEKLIFDMFTLNFEQVNHLWGTLGGKYYPNVLYKVRMVTIDENIPDGEGELIKEILINEPRLKN
jgi:Pvc16 N-terminal domain